VTGDYPLGADSDTDAIRDGLHTQWWWNPLLGCEFPPLDPDFPASGAGMVAGSDTGLPATPTT
jgi:hypothetical protein